ncbi:MAG: hypothetical protein ABI684_13295 [Nitrospirota bacterium]
MVDRTGVEIFQVIALGKSASIVPDTLVGRAWRTSLRQLHPAGSLEGAAFDVVVHSLWADKKKLTHHRRRLGSRLCVKCQLAHQLLSRSVYTNLTGFPPPLDLPTMAND